MTVHEPNLISADPKVWQFRVGDFLLLQENGAFRGYARAELLDGEIWVLNAIHSRHAALQSELHGRLWTALRLNAKGLRCYLTPSIEMEDSSLPEPDLVIGQPHDAGFLPLAKVQLVLEVSDKTLDVDLGRKQRIYATAGIPEYWVADLNARAIQQMWAPAGGAYTARREVAFGQRINAVTLAGLAIATDDL